MASITYQKMRKVYDEGTEAIPGMDLEVPAGMGHCDPVSGLRAVPAHDRRAEHGFALKMLRIPKDEIGKRVQEAADRPLADRPVGPQTQESVRRSAAAGGDGPGHRAAAAGVPDGRTAVEPGR
jgi:hypothetical protein